MKTALVMEGGAMRGMFTCGVIDVLMEQQIEFDGAAGISAGAAFGCNIKSKQIGRAIRYNKKYSKDPRFCSIRSLIRTGDMFGADFCYRELPMVLDPFDTKTFAENPMEFYCGAVDAQSGEMVYHLCKDGEQTDIDWMRASASMPIVSRPVKIEGYELLDGGIIDSVPHRFMMEQGYDRNVVVLTQPKGYRKKKTSALPLMKLVLKKYPKIYEAMSVRHLRYNEQMDEIDRLEREGKIYVVRPEMALGISRTEDDPEELERVYQLGRAEGFKCLEEIKKFLNENKEVME